jgi:leucyl-tRNA synthetase
LLCRSQIREVFYRLNKAALDLESNSCLVADEVEIVLQVNGKLRDRITVAIGIEKADLEALALVNDRVKEFTNGVTVRKVIVVPGKIVNVVAN